MSKFMNEKGFKILEVLDEIALKNNCKPAAVALAWYMARPSVTAPIASATSVQQLSELVQATKIKLNTYDILKIDTCSMYSS